MSAPNAALAYQVLDHIDAHPEQWSQGFYIGPADCGTVACFAGWACLLSGEKPMYPPGARGYSTSYIEDHDGEPLYVSDRAEQLLRAGRYVEHAKYREEEDGPFDLFNAYNTREDLGRLVAEIFGPRPTGGEGGSVTGGAS